LSDYWHEQRYDDAFFAIHSRMPGEPKPKPTRILITGSRDYTSVHAMRTVLRAILDEHGQHAVIVHGDARGADRLAAQIAEAFGMKTEPWPADWDRRGKAAGFIRNQAMVDAGADLCLAFLVAGLPCKGTRDCAHRAEKAGIPVRWHTQGAR
jgi:hypothetical protein